MARLLGLASANSPSKLAHQAWSVRYSIAAGRLCFDFSSRCLNRRQCTHVDPSKGDAANLQSGLFHRARNRQGLAACRFCLGKTTLLQARRGRNQGELHCLLSRIPKAGAKASGSFSALRDYDGNADIGQQLGDVPGVKYNRFPRPGGPRYLFCSLGFPAASYLIAGRSRRSQYSRLRSSPGQR